MEIISQVERKRIVIDNADILLDDDTRKHISLDGKNQYLIIGRNPGICLPLRRTCSSW